LSYNVTNGLDLRVGGESINKSRVSTNMNNGSRINYYSLTDLLKEHGPTRDDVMKWARAEAKLETLKK